MNLFAQSRGYVVLDWYNQYVDAMGLTHGFTYEQYKAEIDAGRPVLLHVTDHTMLGFGYSEEDPDLAGDVVYLHNTWDHDDHKMVWGTDYGGRDHLAVSVIQLEAVTNEPPVADAGPDQTVEQADAAGTDVPMDGTGSYDPEGDPLTYTWTWAGGSASEATPTVSLPLGTTTITLTVTDGIYEDSDTVDITVEDTTPPELTVPDDVTAEQEDAAGTVVPLEAVVTDICDADVDLVDDAPAVFPLGDTVVTFTATDDSGNSTSGSMTVTVVDTTAPSVDAGPDITVEQATHAGTEVALSAVVTDICDPAPLVEWSDGPTAVFPLGDTEVTVTATDASGNVGTDTVWVHVIDTTPPEVECVPYENPHGNTEPGGKAKGKGMGVNPDGFYEIIAEDICDAEPDIYIGTIADPYMFGPFLSGVTVKVTEDPDVMPECKMIGSDKGKAGAVYLHVILPEDACVSAVDDWGNVGQCTCLVPEPPK
jgi:hypothetical protein